MLEKLTKPIQQTLLVLGLASTGVAFSQSSAFQTNPAFESEVLNLVNQARADAGLNPLKASAILNKTAREHSFAMAADHFYGHCNPDTKSRYYTRMAANGYPQSGASAENIAAGYTTAAQVMAGWLNSAGHKANILNPHFTEMGVGYIYDVYDQANISAVTSSCNRGNTEPFAYRHYWTQVFGSANTASDGGNNDSHVLFHSGFE